jgi:CubicO group peptidase (beta-lactamase class C family)
VAELDLVRLPCDHASKYSVPGAALGVLSDGAVTTAYCGVTGTATGEAVTAETRFAVGSLGKSMVATAFARLVEAGRLSLDDPAAVHVPELRRTSWSTDHRTRSSRESIADSPARGSLLRSPSG